MGSEMCIRDSAPPAVPCTYTALCTCSCSMLGSKMASACISHNMRSVASDHKTRGIHDSCLCRAQGARQTPVGLWAIASCPYNEQALSRSRKRSGQYFWGHYGSDDSTREFVRGKVLKAMSALSFILAYHHAYRQQHRDRFAGVGMVFCYLVTSGSVGRHNGRCTLLCLKYKFRSDRRLEEKKIQTHPIVDAVISISKSKTNVSLETRRNDTCVIRTGGDVN